MFTIKRDTGGVVQSKPEMRLSTLQRRQWKSLGGAGKVPREITTRRETLPKVLGPHFQT